MNSVFDLRLSENMLSAYFSMFSWCSLVAEALPDVIDFDDVDFSAYEFGGGFGEDESWHNPSYLEKTSNTDRAVAQSPDKEPKGENTRES